MRTLASPLPGIAGTPSAYDRLATAFKKVTGFPPPKNGNWLCPVHDDQKPSLSVKAIDGRVLLHCHAGCGTEEIVATLGLKMADLFDTPATKRPVIRPKPIVYRYRDEKGGVLYHVVRLPGKHFQARTPKPDGGWNWGLGDTRRVLYRLPEVLSAVGAKATIYIVEGEKDANALVRAGYVATCNPFGAGKWRPEYTRALAGASKVVIVADKDEAGYGHARTVRDSLLPVVEEVTMVVAAEGKDVYDHLHAGLSVDELVPWQDPDRAEANRSRVSSGSAPPEDQGTMPGSIDDGQFLNTDLGNARRLVARHGQDMRYVPEWGNWLVWNGSYWELDLTGQVHLWAKDVADSMYAEFLASGNQELFKCSLRCQSAAGLRNAVDVAKSEPGVPVRVRELDSKPYLLTVANGTLDLRTGKLMTPSREHLITHAAPVSWDPQAQCPRWEAFLKRVLPDPERRAFMQRCAGYALTGDVSEQVILVLYGTGANGKSVFKETLLALMGDLAIPAAPKLMIASRHERHPTELADLYGRRLVVSHEVEDGARLDEALVKELTGGDRIKARRMRQDFWDFAPTHKLWLACNHKPRIKGTDNGIWRRVLLVDFSVTIPPDEQDRQLGAKLKAELSGILNWVVDGCLDWQHGGLQAPDAVRDATDEYRKESDLLTQFLEERCQTGEQLQLRAPKLYDEYKSWCRANGLDHPLTLKALTGQLKERGFERKENRLGQSVWLGLELLPETEDCEDDDRDEDDMSRPVISADPCRPFVRPTPEELFLADDRPMGPHGSATLARRFQRKNEGTLAQRTRRKADNQSRPDLSKARASKAGLPGTRKHNPVRQGNVQLAAGDVEASVTTAEKAGVGRTVGRRLTKTRLNGAPTVARQETPPKPLLATRRIVKLDRHLKTARDNKTSPTVPVRRPVPRSQAS